VVVVTSAHYIEAPILLVVPLATAHDEPRQFRPRIEPDAANQLIDSSDAMIDLTMPVRRERFGKRIGALSSIDMAHLDRALFVMLGANDAAP
jgi:mRNA-degrading endonuclease toxin of MazEF toxin-antitoxin module